MAKSGGDGENRRQRQRQRRGRTAGGLKHPPLQIQRLVPWVNIGVAELLTVPLAFDTVEIGRIASAIVR